MHTVCQTSYSIPQCCFWISVEDRQVVVIEAGNEYTRVGSSYLFQRVAGVLKRQIYIFEDQPLLWVQ